MPTKSVLGLNTLTHEFICKDMNTDNPRMYIKTHFDCLYRIFVDKSIKEISSATDEQVKLEHIIQLIIWMALSIEAGINNSLHKQITDLSGYTPREANLWNSIKKNATRNKLSLLLELCNSKQKKEKEFLNFYEKLFALRNRLVHYKEDPTEVNFHKGEGCTSVKEYFESFGNPKIVDELLHLDIKEQHERFTSLIGFINECVTYEKA